MEKSPARSPTAQFTVEHLRAAAIDGRTANTRYRQDELHKLHRFILGYANEFCDAIVKDSSCTTTEAETEFLLVTIAVKSFYKELNFAHALAEEYAVAQGRDNTERRVGYGIVVIRPTAHTRLFSILVPAAAAIAAGNCILLELPQSMQSVDAILRDGLPKALDRDTFGIVTSKVEDQLLQEDTLLVNQVGDASPATIATLKSGAQARAIAVVDRTADIDQAAKAITYARFRFQGTSPYSPDLVLVNEFVKDAFTEACMKYTSLFFSSKSNAQQGLARNADTMSAIDAAEAKGELTTFGSTSYLLAHITDRSCPVADSKVVGCILPTMSISGLIDVVQLQMNKTKLLATYIFASQSNAKFLAQHLNTHLTLINQIPLHLLVGPAAPLDSHPCFVHRYSTEMMSTLRPQYITIPSSTLTTVTQALESRSTSATDNTLRNLAVQPLPPTKQAPGHAIGFFEQGILTGALVMIVPVMGAVGYGAFVSARYLWRSQLSRFV